MNSLQQLQDTIFQELDKVGIDYTYWNSYTMVQGITMKYFLIKEKFDDIFKNIDLKENTKNFLSQCYKTMHINRCEKGEGVIEKTEYIDFESINTLLCIEYGEEYLAIMKMPEEAKEQ